MKVQFTPGVIKFRDKFLSQMQGFSDLSEASSLCILSYFTIFIFLALFHLMHAPVS